jgi:hypothetical protein
MDCCWKLRVAKGQSTPSAASQPSHKNVSQSEWDITPPSSNQQTTVSANTFERSETDAAEELPTAEYEGYCVYFFCCCRIGYYHVTPFIIYYYHCSPSMTLIWFAMLSDEIKSVYVRNLSPTVSPSEVEEEFKSFGRIRPDGVVIRSRKVYVFS